MQMVHLGMGLRQEDFMDMLIENMVGRALSNTYSDEDSDDERDPFNDINELLLRMITISAFGLPTTPPLFLEWKRGHC